MPEYQETLRNHLVGLYGREAGEQAVRKLSARLDKFLRDFGSKAVSPPAQTQVLTEKDAMLITYGDQFSEPAKPPLQSLNDFLNQYLTGALNAVHILPFYPYTSDDGFSVVDYRAIDPALGTWDHVTHLGSGYKLMFDAVINHISRQSDWFQGYLAGSDTYRDYFIEADPATDLSQVTRPRALPLLTPVETSAGPRHVWTTFSDDQIDLNFANPDVLLEIIDILLLYLEKGAKFIRLDAIAYLWKEIGTTCIHLPQTHRVVKLIRTIFDAVAPGTVIITETNVPHEDNISYFGEYDPSTGRYDEAQMVYQFPLAPLVLHSLYTGSAAKLSRWAAALQIPSPETTFFNFIASHDGIGVMPARGLLTEAEIQELVDKTLAHGGRLGLKANPDGSESVYELNITLFDALNNPAFPDEELDIPRFIASQAIMLSLAGVPGIYVHSLFGSRNCQTCLSETGRNRSINREKFDKGVLDLELADPGSLKARVFRAYRDILEIRTSEPAFHPFGDQHVISLKPEVFSILRRSLDGTEVMICLINVGRNPCEVSIDLPALNLPSLALWRDLIPGQAHRTDRDSQMLSLTLAPYQVSWLKPAAG